MRNALTVKCKLGYDVTLVTDVHNQVFTPNGLDIDQYILTDGRCINSNLSDYLTAPQMLKGVTQATNELNKG